MCFQDAGLTKPDVLFITVRDCAKPVVVLMEAKGAPALWKSVTVITETGQHWTVAPTFLRKIKPVREAASEGGQVISLPKK